MTGGRVSGKVAIVTGAAMGMGESHARRLAEEGASVVLTDIDADLGEAVAASIGPAAKFVRHDVTDEAGWAAVIGAAEEAFGPATILVNNAGIVDMVSIEEMDLSRYQRMIAINQVGPFLGMKAVVPAMRQAGRGSIINISSVAGFAPAGLLSAYTATKFAIRGMSKAASIDLAKDNIRVNSVHPGGIMTPMMAGATGLPKIQAIKRWGEPREVSNVVLFLASEESSFVTGAEYVVDGGYLNVVGEVVI